MRLKLAYLFLLVCVIASCFSGCITPTVYRGDKVSTSELCQIRGAKEKVALYGRMYLEAALLVKIDDQAIGSYCKGWPKAVKTKPGERVIQIRHYKEWEDTSHPRNIVRVGISDNGQTESYDYCKHYLIKFKAEKAKKYVIAFQRHDEKNDISELTLTDEETGQPVVFHIEAVPQDKLFIR